MNFTYRLGAVIGRCKFIRLGIRRRLVKAFFPPLKIPPASFQTRFRGWKYEGNFENIQDWHVYFFGGFELKELALLDDILKSAPGTVAFDIGANIGGHSLSMARCASHVISFEPVPDLANNIESQISLNGIQNISLNRFGLGEACDKLPFFMEEGARNKGTGSFLHDHAEASTEIASLEIRKGDELPPIDRLDLIKIDIEGYEAPALAGLRDVLARHKPIILMEVTESSMAMFAERGGIASVLPFSYLAYRVCNPSHVFGIFPKNDYRLRLIDEVTAEKISFNILIVPKGNAFTPQNILT